MVGGGDHVDDGVADAEDIEAGGLLHGDAAFVRGIGPCSEGPVAKEGASVPPWPRIHWRGRPCSLPFRVRSNSLATPRCCACWCRARCWRSACFALLAFGSFEGLHHWLARDGWLGWLAGALGGLAAAATALWLFVPVAIIIAGLFLDPICRAVERRWYSGPAAAFAGQYRGAELGWGGRRLQVLLLTLFTLPLAFFPAADRHGGRLGGHRPGRSARGLFVAVAMRRMSRQEAAALYGRMRPSVLSQGAVLALAGYVPLLNLLGSDRGDGGDGACARAGRDATFTGVTAAQTSR